MCLQGKSKEFIADVYIIWGKLEITVIIEIYDKMREKIKTEQYDK